MVEGSGVRPPRTGGLVPASTLPQGAVPSADGVVQLDARCMHGPTGWAGGVAAMEGVRAASGVARAVMRQTDLEHRLDPEERDSAKRRALRRFRDAIREKRLLNDRGLPAFDVRFFVLGRKGEHAGVALYGAAESRFAVCDGNGSLLEPLEGLLAGAPVMRCVSPPLAPAPLRCPGLPAPGRSAPRR